MREPRKRERDKSETVGMLTVSVLWAAHVWNATGQDAAQQVVADLYAHLSHGGNVSVRIAELGGQEYTVEVTAGSPIHIIGSESATT